MEDEEKYLCPRCQTVLNLSEKELEKIGVIFFQAVHRHSACRTDAYYRNPDDYVLLPYS